MRPISSFQGVSFKSRAAEDDATTRILTSHEEWEELGIYANSGISDSVPTGSKVNMMSLAVLEPVPASAGGSVTTTATGSSVAELDSGSLSAPVDVVTGSTVPITVDLTKTVSGISIQPDFSSAGSTTYTYRLFNGTTPLMPIVTPSAASGW